MVRSMQPRKEPDNWAVSDWTQAGIVGNKQGWTYQGTMRHQLWLCS